MITPGAAGAMQLGLGVGLSFFDIIRGEMMRKKNEEALRNLKRPQQQISQGLQQKVELARQDSLMGMPGYDIALNQSQLGLQQGLGNVMRASTSSVDAQAAATQGMMSQQDALAQLAMQNAQYIQQGRRNYGSTLGELGQAQDQQFMMNQFIPFQEKRQQYMDNIGQGRNLTASGFGGLGGSLGQSMPYFAAGKDWNNFKYFMPSMNSGYTTNQG